MKRLLSLIVLLYSSFLFSQKDSTSTDYKRLRGLITPKTIFYNVDGVDFTSQITNYNFTDKNLKKLFKKYGIGDDEIKMKDENICNLNSCVTKIIPLTKQLNQISSFYFIEGKNKKITIIWFGYFTVQDKNWERIYVNRILNNEIPKEVFENMTIESIDFAGRKIKLENNCYWTKVNTVQCPFFGEMNWSVHQTLASAQSAIDNQWLVIQHKNKGKIISEETKIVFFEGTETLAKKVVYDFSGTNSILAGMSGAKALTMYFVAAKVRNNYVSCCMSYWNNDVKTESGLAPLLEKVMKIKS